MSAGPRWRPATNSAIRRRWSAASRPWIRTPRPSSRRAVTGAFGTPGTFEDLQVLVAREAYPAFFAPVLPLERDAVRIHGWELGAIPGLLQTEDYARSLIRVSRPMDTASAVDRLVAARIARQAILASEGPPALWYILDESVLRHVVGGFTVMGAQLDRLIEATDTPGIVIQVLPFKADHPGTDGPISVYEFADARSSLLYGVLRRRQDRGRTGRGRRLGDGHRPATCVRAPHQRIPRADPQDTE